MFCSLEKLKIGMSASLLFGLFLTAHGEYIRGRLDSKYLSSMGRNLFWRACGMTICGKDALDCHFAHTKSKECYQINLPLQLLLKWFREKIGIIKDKKMKIYYFYTDRADIMTEKPKVWWLYDNVSKGRNFGTAGSALDIPVGSVVWANDAKGPRAGSPLLYAQGKKFEKVALRHNGKLLLDLVQKFTISMWVKTDNSWSRHPPLLGSLPHGATRLQFWGSNPINTLELWFNKERIPHRTQKNTWRSDWRHVAVAYKPGSSPIFFLNGDVWPLESDPGDVKNRIQPTHLVMWDHGYPTGYSSYYKFPGKIACVMVFQAALSQSQIKILKDNCP